LFCLWPDIERKNIIRKVRTGSGLARQKDRELRFPQRQVADRLRRFVIWLTRRGRKVLPGQAARL
jgi:hypothetical protein